MLFAFKLKRVLTSSSPVKHHRRLIYFWRTVGAKEELANPLFHFGVCDLGFHNISIGLL